MKGYLYLTTIISVTVGINSKAIAQCVSTQDCATLGYIESSCSNGGIKCPFGNQWYCNKSDSEVCEKNGFSYTCTGGNQTGGAGKTCNGKYAECTCAENYIWKNGKCVISEGAYGDLYYCNGDVVGVKTPDMKFYVAVKDLGQMNYYNAKSSCTSYIFCGKRKGVLPETSHLQTIYQNKSAINDLLLANGGTKMTESYYWSATNYGGFHGYGCSQGYVNMSNGSRSSNCETQNYYVRPILTSYQAF